MPTCLLQAESRAVGQVPFQVVAGYALHHDVGGAVVATSVVKRGDVVVLQPPAGAHLCPEADLEQGPFLCTQSIQRDRLDRHRSVDLRVMALVDHAHPAPAEQADDAVAAETVGLHVGRHCCRTGQGRPAGRDLLPGRDCSGVPRDSLTLCIAGLW